MSERGRTARILWLWLSTSFRAAPALMAISTVLVAARAITAPAQTYGVSRLVDGIASDQSSTIALGVGIIIGGLAVSFLADGLGWPLQDTAAISLHGRVLNCLASSRGIAPTASWGRQPVSRGSSARGALGVELSPFSA